MSRIRPAYGPNRTISKGSASSKGSAPSTIRPAVQIIHLPYRFSETKWFDRKEPRGYITFWPRCQLGNGTLDPSGAGSTAPVPEQSNLRRTMESRHPS